MSFDPLFIEEAPLASDLEWMLQSGQASSTMLAEALLTEFYSPVYQMAFAVLGDESQARFVAAETFSTALLNIYRYRSQSGVRLWLFRLEVEVLRGLKRKQQMQAFFARTSRSVDKNGASAEGQSIELDERNDPYESLNDDELSFEMNWKALDDKARLAASFHCLLDLSSDEIAGCMQTRPRNIEMFLSDARGQLEACLGWEDQGLSGAGWEEAVDRLMGERLQEWFTISETIGTDLASLATEAAARANQRGLFRRKVFSFREAIAIGALVVLGVLAIWGASRMLPESTSPESVHKAVAAAEMTPTLSPTPSRPVYYLVRPGDSLVSIAASLQTSVDELSRLNHLSPSATLQPGERLQVVVGDSQEMEIEAFAAAAVVRSEAVPKALSDQSTSQEIQQRLALSSSLWQTLWFEVQMVNYGPPSYIGPSLAYRFQGWVQQPSDSLEVLGPLQGNPLTTYLATKGHTYYYELGSDQVYVDAPWMAGGGQLLSRPELNKMVFPDQSQLIERDGAFKVIESGQVAGRFAVVVDFHDAEEKRQARLWVDVRTGLILRQQIFSSVDPAIVSSEVVFTQVVFDKEIAPEIFSPDHSWESGFANDFQATPQPTEQLTFPGLAVELPNRPSQEYILPPPGFDPSASMLTFQFPSTLDPAQVVASPPDEIPLDLFADGYHLGRVKFALPGSLVCTRSKDGKRVAFAASAYGFESEAGAVHWFNLSRPDKVYQPLPGFTSNQFAFSPDGMRLAIFGHNRTDMNGSGLYIMNLGNGENRKLIELADARSLVWSPDGQYLALIGLVENSGQEEILVLRVGSGGIIYRASGSFDAGVSSPDWPTNEWGVDFPVVEMGGMEACAQP